MFPTKRKRFCLTESGATIGIGPPLLVALAGFLLPCCPLLGQRLRNNASASRHLDGAFERGDGPLIHHGAVKIPALAHVEQAVQLKLTRVGLACSLLRREGLVPVGHSDNDFDAIKPLKLGPVARAGELLN